MSVAKERGQEGGTERDGSLKNRRGNMQVNGHAQVDVPTGGEPRQTSDIFFDQHTAHQNEDSSHDCRVFTHIFAVMLLAWLLFT